MSEVLILNDQIAALLTQARDIADTACRLDDITPNQRGVLFMLRANADRCIHASNYLDGMGEEGLLPSSSR